MYNECVQNYHISLHPFTVTWLSCGSDLCVRWSGHCRVKAATGTCHSLRDTRPREVLSFSSTSTSRSTGYGGRTIYHGRMVETLNNTHMLEYTNLCFTLQTNNYSILFWQHTIYLSWTDFHLALQEHFISHRTLKNLFIFPILFVP